MKLSLWMLVRNASPVSSTPSLQGAILISALPAPLGGKSLPCLSQHLAKSHDWF